MEKLVSRVAHNHKVGGSSPSPATNEIPRCPCGNTYFGVSFFNIFGEIAKSVTYQYYLTALE